MLTKDALVRSDSYITWKKSSGRCLKADNAIGLLCANCLQRILSATCITLMHLLPDKRLIDFVYTGRFKPRAFFGSNNTSTLAMRRCNKNVEPLHTLGTPKHSTARGCAPALAFPGRLQKENTVYNTVPPGISQLETSPRSMDNGKRCSVRAASPQSKEHSCHPGSRFCGTFVIMRSTTSAASHPSIVDKHGN